MGGRPGDGRGPGRPGPEGRLVREGAGDRASSGGPAFVLDIRGRRADEAVAELAAFLDESVLAGRTQLEIVHGKGTGALRREVHEFLRSAPQVASFRLAPADRAGTA